jgi:hypothetical protein
MYFERKATRLHLPVRTPSETPIPTQPEESGYPLYA